MLSDSIGLSMLIEKVYEKKRLQNSSDIIVVGRKIIGRLTSLVI